jgi:mono/diheme cytochrome c family protein
MRITKRLTIVFLIALVGIAGAIALFPRLGDSDNTPVIINNTSVPPVPTLPQARVAEGAALYAQYCARCHGADLEGAPDWKNSLPDGSLPPPPQDSSGHTWHHSDSLLLDIIANGGDPADNSKMPAFDDQITENEMTSILDFIKSKWGTEERDFQWWITVTQRNP